MLTAYRRPLHRISLPVAVLFTTFHCLFHRPFHRIFTAYSPWFRCPAGHFPTPAVPCSAQCNSLIKAESALWEDLIPALVSTVDREIVGSAQYLLQVRRPITPSPPHSHHRPLRSASALG